MILIIGGAYQGKLDFAKDTFGITDADVHTCGSEEIDFSKRCIYKIEEFTLHHPDPVSYFKASRESWQDSILIIQDIFCGVVPMVKGFIPSDTPNFRQFPTERSSG